MGETEEEGMPKRIVVLDTGESDSATSLGVAPVGAVETGEGLGLPSYLEDTGETENVGTIEEPNLEKIPKMDGTPSSSPSTVSPKIRRKRRSPQTRSGRSSKPSKRTASTRSPTASGCSASALPPPRASWATSKDIWPIARAVRDQPASACVAGLRYQRSALLLLADS